VIFEQFEYLARRRRMHRSSSDEPKPLSNHQIKILHWFVLHWCIEISRMSENHFLIIKSRYYIDKEDFRRISKFYYKSGQKFITIRAGLHGPFCNKSPFCNKTCLRQHFWYIFSKICDIWKKNHVIPTPTDALKFVGWVENDFQSLNQDMAW